MNFTCYGEKSNKSILFIHGLASTADLCFKPLLPYLTDYDVIFCELDGHCDSCINDMISMEKTIEDIESFILNELNGELYGLCGFSMGGTLAVDLISRGNIRVEKVLLDAPITVDLGLMAYPCTYAFIIGTNIIKKGKKIPNFLLDLVAGKDNTSIIEMMYAKISKTTIKNVCNYIYHYKFSENLNKYPKPVLLWRGSEESIPAKSQKNLQKYLPQMTVEVFEGLGHGQFLHESPKEYAERLKKFMDD
ncbi:alpha/beta fold hydrolase [Anaerococcus lactolyticus]|uniref:alpha/beta fold hydrolase n=1 Tax=Anaerococcus lactolyticus TaxID=33032 RepID=UPI0028898BD7|nr:alpha/beta hydrolase [Anaerococcus lactolyticus]